MNFDTWFNSLQTRTACHTGAGLAAFGELLVRLNSPQKKFNIIHVAGTNGKGTVCTLLAQVLVRAGYKTGLFISPHLISPTERIQINGTEISPVDFITTVETVLAQEKEPLNLFEVLTAASLVYFAEKKVQYAVLETGLGGRKDPTNSCVPVLSIITSIGLDHTHILGNTLEQIATEKAGIIKPGVPVLCGYLPAEAVRIVQETAYEQNAPLEMTHVENQPGQAYEQNVHLVSRAADVLKVPAALVRQGLETAKLPGRFEVFRQGNKTIILDGAHNPPAIENLIAFWQTTPLARARACVLCGFMQDKDYPRMLRMLSARFKTGIVTCPPSPRAAGEPQVKPLLPPGWKFIPQVSAALAQAQKQAEVVLCTGSFYIAGALRRSITGKK